MKLARGISALCLLTMSGTILHAFIVGDFYSEGAQLFAMAWGKTTLVDLYIGFVFFSMWIIFRERSLLRSLIWAGSILLLGNWASALYLLVTLNSSGGDWDKFFLGSRRVSA